MAEERRERGMIKDRSLLKPLETRRDRCCTACSSITCIKTNTGLLFLHTTCGCPKHSLDLRSDSPWCTNLVFAKSKVHEAISVWASNIKHCPSVIMVHSTMNQECTNMSWIISAFHSAIMLSWATQIIISFVRLPSKGKVFTSLYGCDICANISKCGMSDFSASVMW